MKQHTYEHVKNFLFAHNIILRSDLYINNKQKLQCECMQCGCVWLVRFDNVRHGTGCPRCAGLEKLSYENVRQFLFDKNIKLLSKEYQNNHTKLDCRCLKCDYLWSPRFNDVQQGQGCPKCAKHAPHSREEVIQILREYNIELLSAPEAQIRVETKLQCKCLICNNIWSPTLHNIQNDHQCPMCAKDNRKQTCLEKYGVDSPMKVKEFQDKCALSVNNSGVVYHWKTGEKLVWVGGYEFKVLKYLDMRQENYVWHPGPFTMPDGRTYTPDLYLEDQNLYVEIKGYHRGDSEEKWNWFHKEHPNSEIWFEKDLKLKGIL